MSFVFLGAHQPESGRVGRKRVEGCVTGRELDERIKSQSIPCPIHEMIPVKDYHGTRNWIRIFEWIFDHFSGPGTRYETMRKHSNQMWDWDGSMGTGFLSNCY